LWRRTAGDRRRQPRRRRLDPFPPPSPRLGAGPPGCGRCGHAGDNRPSPGGWGSTAPPAAFAARVDAQRRTGSGRGTAPAGGVAGAVARSDSGGDEPDPSWARANPRVGLGLPLARDVKPGRRSFFSAGL